MRLSTGLANAVSDTSCIQDALNGYVIDIYSGVQPTTPDSAANGVLLATITQSGNAYTPETASSGTLTVTGASGSFTAVTVNSVDILGGTVAYTTSVANTATLLAAQINLNPKNRMYRASTTGLTGVVTLTAVNGLGTLPNTWAVSATTTCTATYAAFSGGVDAVNGLHFGTAAAGVIGKLSTETWQGSGLVDGTAGWYRIRGTNDSGAGATTTAVRADGGVSTSGADMTVGSLTVTTGAPFIVSAGAITLPTA